MVVPGYSGAWMRLSYAEILRVEHNFCINCSPSSQRGEAEETATCDSCHRLGILFKKGLAFRENRPILKIPPRPGPGSSGQAVSGSPSTPGAVGPPLSFWGKIRFPDLRLVPYFSLFFVGVRGRLHASPPFSQSAPKSWDQARWWGVFYPRSPSARDRGHRRGWTHSLGGLKPSFILVVEWRG